MKTMKLMLLLATILAASSCRCSKPPSPKGGSSTLSIQNDTNADTVVYVAFGANSAVLPASWAFCAATSNLTCNFPLPAHGQKDLPLGGQFLNVTMAFGAAVGCGSTKAEMTLNNPAWYDVADVSLVDGYSNRIAIDVGGTKLGPPLGRDGNEKVFGLFPYGCDICVSRQAPPCGIAPGGTGCKAGSQYAPDVPCQYQGPIMGGGSVVKVLLVK
jgi:hypothetical protein